MCGARFVAYAKRLKTFVKGTLAKWPVTRADKGWAMKRALRSSFNV